MNRIRSRPAVHCSCSRPAAMCSAGPLLHACSAICCAGLLYCWSQAKNACTMQTLIFRSGDTLICAASLLCAHGRRLLVQGGPPPGFGAPSALQNGPTSSLSTPMPAPASSSFVPLDPSTPHSPSNMWATGSSPLSLGPLLEPYDPLATTPPARSQSRFRFAQADAAGGAAARHSTQAVLQQAAGADISLLSQKLQAMGAAGNPQLHHAGSGSQPLSPGALLLRQLHMGPTGARAGANNVYMRLTDVAWSCAFKCASPTPLAGAAAWQCRLYQSSCEYFGKYLRSLRPAQMDCIL